jgi:hypothetical protein
MMTRRHLRLVLALLLPLLAVRALLPDGYMVTTESGKLRMIICSAGFAGWKPSTLPAEHQHEHQHEQHQHDEDRRARIRLVGHCCHDRDRCRPCGIRQPHPGLVPARREKKCRSTEKIAQAGNPLLQVTGRAPHRLVVCG